MKTKEQILAAVRAGRKSKSFFDGRDYQRLISFFPVSDWEIFGFSLADGHDAPAVEVFSEETVKAHLASDLAFAFEKALNKRGISAGAMYEVVKMWMWVMDDPLGDTGDDYMYPQYGLPFLKEVAIKYSLPNEIGDDRGDESKYESD